MSERIGLGLRGRSNWFLNKGRPINGKVERQKGSDWRSMVCVGWILFHRICEGFRERKPFEFFSMDSRHMAYEWMGLYGSQLQVRGELRTLCVRFPPDPCFDLVDQEVPFNKITSVRIKISMRFFYYLLKEPNFLTPKRLDLWGFERSISMGLKKPSIVFGSGLVSSVDWMRTGDPRSRPQHGIRSVVSGWSFPTIICPGPSRSVWDVDRGSHLSVLVWGMTSQSESPVVIDFHVALIGSQRRSPIPLVRGFVQSEIPEMSSWSGFPDNDDWDRSLWDQSVEGANDILFVSLGTHLNHLKFDLRKGWDRLDEVRFGFRFTNITNHRSQPPHRLTRRSQEGCENDEPQDFPDASGDFHEVGCEVRWMSGWRQFWSDRDRYRQISCGHWSGQELGDWWGFGQTYELDILL